jgi:hypothetical protein
VTVLFRASRARACQLRCGGRRRATAASSCSSRRRSRGGGGVGSVGAWRHAPAAGRLEARAVGRSVGRSGKSYQIRSYRQSASSTRMSGETSRADRAVRCPRSFVHHSACKRSLREIFRYPVLPPGELRCHDDDFGFRASPLPSSLICIDLLAAVFLVFFLYFTH